jgi:hypothetical protein
MGMTTFLLLSLLAQQGWDRVTALRPGQAVMVSYRGGFVEGPLVSASTDQVVVKSRDKEVTAARVDVKKLWVPGHKRGRNAAIGAAIGVGAAIGPALLVGTRFNNETGNGGAVGGALVGIGAGAGAGLGALNQGRDLVYKAP